MRGKERNQNFYVDIMNLHQEVTGSCIMLVVAFPNGTSKHILIDCGLFQEKQYEAQNDNFLFEEKKVDHVILTHNHVDHIGRVPLLYKNGFRNEIHVSNPTAELISLGLKDSCKVLQKKSVTERKMQKKLKKSYDVIKNPAKKYNRFPLYDYDHVNGTLELIVGHDYRVTFNLDDNIKLTFFENGHLPGAIVGLLQISFPNYPDINVLFTGDYSGSNLLYDVPSLPDWVKELPLTIIQECTYGNVDSSSVKNVFYNNMERAIFDNKTILIPAFSLGRTQNLMYILRKMQDSGKLDVNIPVYLDGKLGISYTKIYAKNKLGLKIENKNDFTPRNFNFVVGTNMRNNIFLNGGPKIVLTSSGMASHGWAPKYLTEFLPRKDVLVHFTGYVADGTLGRELYECSNGDMVFINGKPVIKAASVEYTSEFSSHARKDELLSFLKQFKRPKLILLNHGSIEAQKAYYKYVYESLNPKDLELLNGTYLYRINSYGLIKKMPTKFYN